MENERLAEQSISSMTKRTISGSPVPPYCGSALMAVQPSAV